MHQCVTMNKEGLSKHNLSLHDKDDLLYKMPIYGMPKEFIYMMCDEVIMKKTTLATDFSYLFEFVSAVTMDLMSAQATQTSVSALATRIGWYGGVERDIYFRDWLLNPMDTWQETFRNWANDQFTMIYFEQSEELSFFAAIDILRSSVSTVEHSVLDVTGSYWRRRTGMVHFSTIPFWASFSGHWPTLKQMYVDVDYIRTLVTHRPDILMMGALKIAKKYGVEHQLERAWTRMTAICCGPLLPLAPSNDDTQYVAITPFFEMGRLPSACVWCPHIGWAVSRWHNAAVGAHNAGYTEDNILEQRKMLTEKFNDVISNILWPHQPLILFLWLVCELTFACYSVVVNTLGVPWSHMQPFNCMHYYYANKMLEPRRDGKGTLYPSVAVAATVKVVLTVSNIAWPQECLPLTDFIIPSHIRERLFGCNSVSVGNTRHIIGWINHIIALPDIVPFGCKDVVGNLSAVLLFTDCMVGPIGFNLLAAKPTDYFMEQLKKRNPCFDLYFLREISLFVSVLVCAAHRYAAMINHGRVAEIRVLNDQHTLPLAWNWDNRFDYLLNGETVLPALKWHRITLGPCGNRLLVDRLQNAPSWLNWEWDRTCECVHASTFQYFDMDADDPAMCMPYVNMRDIPPGVLLEMSPWWHVMPNNAVVLNTIDWWKYTAKGGIPHISGPRTRFMCFGKCEGGERIVHGNKIGVQESLVTLMHDGGSGRGNRVGSPGCGNGGDNSSSQLS